LEPIADSGQSGETRDSTISGSSRFSETNGNANGSRFSEGNGGGNGGNGGRSSGSAGAKSSGGKTSGSGAAFFGKLFSPREDDCFKLTYDELRADKKLAGLSILPALDKSHFQRALKLNKPSVNASDLARFEEWTRLHGCAG
jgi:hypothetical protein